MAEDINGLIAKIQQEGVEAAEAKAKTIEEQARAQAREIISEAEKKTKTIVAEGKSELARMEKSARVSLEQAGRDLLLGLRAQISAMLDRLIRDAVRQALKPEEITRIISALLAGLGNRQQDEIIISVPAADLKKLKQDLFGQLAEEVKKGVSLKPDGEIKAGFTISYDEGKSHFDFTDKGLTEYLSGQLKPELAGILQQAAAKSKSRT